MSRSIEKNTCLLNETSELIRKMSDIYKNNGDVHIAKVLMELSTSKDYFNFDEDDNSSVNSVELMDEIKMENIGEVMSLLSECTPLTQNNFITANRNNCPSIFNYDTSLLAKINLAIRADIINKKFKEVEKKIK